MQVGADRVSKPHSREGAEEWRQDLNTASSALRQKSGVEIGEPSRDSCDLCHVRLHYADGTWTAKPWQ